MSSLADVKDMDCLISFNPLAFDLGSAYVTGADAILRRVLYRWCTLLGTMLHAPGLGMSRPLLDADGATFSPADLQGLRASLEAQAKDTPFVAECSAPVKLDANGSFTVRGKVVLTDNRAYALELSVTDARPVLLKLGSETS